MKLKTTETKVNFLAQDGAARRVMIAQDVIASVLAGKLIAKRGQYISTVKPIIRDGELVRGGNFYSWSDDMSLGEVDICHSIHDQEKVCLCCARGAMLVSRLGYQHPVDQDCKEDLLTKEDVDLTEGLQNHSVLLSDFDRKQIGMIESAFEVSAEFGGYTQAAKVAAEFGSEYSNASDRLIAIMQNIIDNSGEFIPPTTEEDEEEDEE